MAKIQVSPEFRLDLIAEAAGQDLFSKRKYVDGCLFVEDVTQEALDVALTNYDNSKESAKIKWQQKMRETDNLLPRFMEDVIDALPDDVKLKLPKALTDKIEAKKLLRKEKPKE